MNSEIIILGGKRFTRREGKNGCEGCYLQNNGLCPWPAGIIPCTPGTILVSAERDERERREELIQLVKPIQQWLDRNADPHHVVHISTGGMTLATDVYFTPRPEDEIPR